MLANDARVLSLSLSPHLAPLSPLNGLDNGNIEGL